MNVDLLCRHLFLLVIFQSPFQTFASSVCEREINTYVRGAGSTAKLKHPVYCYHLFATRYARNFALTNEQSGYYARRICSSFDRGVLGHASSRALTVIDWGKWLEDVDTLKASLKQIESSYKTKAGINKKLSNMRTFCNARLNQCDQKKNGRMGCVASVVSGPLCLHVQHKCFKELSMLADFHRNHWNNYLLSSSSGALRSEVTKLHRDRNSKNVSKREYEEKLKRLMIKIDNGQTLAKQNAKYMAGVIDRFSKVANDSIFALSFKEKPDDRLAEMFRCPRISLVNSHWNVTRESSQGSTPLCWAYASCGALSAISKSNVQGPKGCGSIHPLSLVRHLGVGGANVGEIRKVLNRVVRHGEYCAKDRVDQLLGTIDGAVSVSGEDGGFLNLLHYPDVRKRFFKRLAPESIAWTILEGKKMTRVLGLAGKSPSSDTLLEAMLSECGEPHLCRFTRRSFTVTVTQKRFPERSACAYIHSSLSKGIPVLIAVENHVLFPGYPGGHALIATAIDYFKGKRYYFLQNSGGNVFASFKSPLRPDIHGCDFRIKSGGVVRTSFRGATDGRAPLAPKEHPSATLIGCWVSEGAMFEKGLVNELVTFRASDSSRKIRTKAQSKY